MQRLTKSQARVKKYGEVYTPDWVVKQMCTVVSEQSDVIDGYGTVVYHRRYVCKKCLREYEETDYV